MRRVQQEKERNIELVQHEKVQHVKSVTRENETWNMEIMQLDQSETQKECNMKKAQREKNPT